MQNCAVFENRLICVDFWSAIYFTVRVNEMKKQ